MRRLFMSFMLAAGAACVHAVPAGAAFVFKPGVKWGNALLSRQLGILTPPESPAPLFIGCDLERLDPLARALLTNDEVLDIDQDALGKAGRPVVHTPDYDVWLRPLADGSWAIALFNRTWEEREIAANFSVLGLPPSCTVRDVWAQKDLGVFKGRFAASIPGHAALLYRLRLMAGDVSGHALVRGHAAHFPLGLRNWQKR